MLREFTENATPLAARPQIREPGLVYLCPDALIVALSLFPHQPRLVPVPVARFFGVALVVQFLAASERDGDLGPPLGVEIDAQKHDG
jgi:hypothetical protein